jgi:hypothetical protein
MDGRINKLVTVFANPIPKSPIMYNTVYQLYSILQISDLSPFTAPWRHDLLWSSNYHWVKARMP